MRAQRHEEEGEEKKDLERESLAGTWKIRRRKDGSMDSLIYREQAGENTFSYVKHCLSLCLCAFVAF